MQAARSELQGVQIRAAKDADAAAMNAQALQAQLQDLHADAALVPGLQEELRLLRQQLDVSGKECMVAKSRCQELQAAASVAAQQLASNKAAAAEEHAAKQEAEQDRMRLQVCDVQQQLADAQAQLRRAEHQLQEQAAEHRWVWVRWANAQHVGWAWLAWHGEMSRLQCFTPVLWTHRPCSFAFAPPEGMK